MRPLPSLSSLRCCQGGGGGYSTEGFRSTALNSEPQLGCIAKAVLHRCQEAQLLEMLYRFFFPLNASRAKAAVVTINYLNISLVQVG